MARSSSSVDPARGRGTSAGIDARQIVEAARAIAPSALTMQAVARELGVDRSAVNYHVKDREGLLELVARDAFTQAFSRFEFPREDDWRAGCLAYARAMRDALVSTGTLASWFRYDAAGGLDLLRPAEDLLAKLFEAGFDAQRVAQGSLMLANIAMSLARDLIFIEVEGEHPQLSVLHLVLERSDANQFPALRRVVATAVDDAYGEQQLRFALEVFVHGFERALPEPPA